MKRLPIGIEDFEKIRQEDYYYVDKTGMIGDIIRKWRRGDIVYKTTQIW